jgi:hypothetical protein
MFRTQPRQERAFGVVPVERIVQRAERRRTVVVNRSCKRCHGRTPDGWIAEPNGRVSTDVLEQQNPASPGARRRSRTACRRSFRSSRAPVGTAPMPPRATRALGVRCSSWAYGPFPSCSRRTTMASSSRRRQARRHLEGSFEKSGQPALTPRNVPSESRDHASESALTSRLTFQTTGAWPR